MSNYFGRKQLDSKWKLISSLVDRTRKDSQGLAITGAITIQQSLRARASDCSDAVASNNARLMALGRKTNVNCVLKT